MRDCAVGVRHDQAVGPVRQLAEHGDIGDARGKRAADAEDLLEHHVGDLMAGERRPARFGADLVAEQALPT